jgi:hypothetical protein
MAYMRHRSRSIQESVFQDLQDTLIACRWMAGTTKQVVADPDTGNVGIITRLEADVYPITDENPIELLDYFPEPGTATALNTFAVDVAQPGESDEWELGSNMRTQPYLFGFVLFASSDAVAVAVMNDLADRYFGRIVRPEYIDLFDHSNPALIDPVSRLDVDVFRYSRDVQTAAPHEVHLYVAELEITDYPPDDLGGEELIATPPIQRVQSMAAAIVTPA